MDTTLIEQFDEKKCKTVLDFCAKRAYGRLAKFIFAYDGNPMVKIGGGINLYLFRFSMSNADFYNTHDKSYKTALKKMMSSLKLETDYISCFNDQSHFLDGSMSIESILVEADLMEFNDE